MLYFVKVRIDLSKLAELGQKIQSGEFEAHPQSTYCLKDDPSVGLNIWEAEDDEDFEREFAPHREYYAEVYEVTPVITAIEAQQLLVEQMTAGS
jgi:hypothetical protein